jgi:quercetin dioxygenase-like cupin family protein
MLLKASRDREWIPTDHAGVERALFRYNETGGRSSFVRLKQGSRVPTHAHNGTEEVVVIEGRLTLGGVAVEAGDYLFTTPGEEHDVVAVTDAVIFVSSQKATPLVEEPR